MKNGITVTVAAAACALVASTLIAAGPVPQASAGPVPQAVASPPATAAAAAEDPDAGLFAATCNKCHDGARITALRRTGPEWEDVLLKMIEKGATGSEKDFETIHAYLLRNFGKVNVNVAAPAEISRILHLSARDAEAIVAYRKANGPFADLAAVRKVPDIDLKMLDQQKDGVGF